MEDEPMIVGYTRDAKGKVQSYHLKELSNTLHTGGGTTSQYVYLPRILQYALRMERTEEEKQRRHIHGDVNAKFSKSKQLAPRKDGVCNTITTVEKDRLIMEELNFRIRKLTPTECFRLMDVGDEDIDKIQAAGISKTQQYKMAGNSIVVSCLYHIFRRIFIDTEVRSLPNLFGERPNTLPVWGAPAIS